MKPALSKKPVIAIDIDEVLFPFTPEFLASHNAKHGTSLEPSDITNYHYIEELYNFKGGEDSEDLIESFFNEVYKGNIGPYNGAIEAIEKLKKNFTLEIVTARRPSTLAITEKWLNRHFPAVFNGVHFPRLKPKDTTKVEVCKEIGAKYLIDDHPDNMQGVHDAGITPLLFGEDYPWNKEHGIEGVIRVKSWAEVLEFFDEEQQTTV